MWYSLWALSFPTQELNLGPLAVEAWGPKHWSTKEFLNYNFLSEVYKVRYFMVVHWLRLCVSCGDVGWIPGRELRSHMPFGVAKKKN